MLFCELGQARKGAAVAKDSCARMWLEIYHPISSVNAVNYTVFLQILPVPSKLTECHMFFSKLFKNTDILK